ncbi:hypothetical protein DXG01_013493 [Tephrocybe rancida]|nr:hypothetical protein DXG01_013493 [Tephrocybe rancida]
MSFNSSDPRPQWIETLPELKHFFEATPSELLADLRYHTTNKNTRQAGNFDKHLHERYRLKHVVLLPEILSDLIDNADNAFNAYPHDFPPVATNIFLQFPTERHLQTSAIEIKHANTINTEADVQSVYEKAIARYCATVAGTLEFQLDRWDTNCLEWNKNRLSHTEIKGVKRAQAVADGFLQLVTRDSRGKVFHMNQRQRAIFDTFPVLAIWEFKNLNFFRDGKLVEVEGKVFREIVRGFLTDVFHWAECEEEGDCALVHPDIGVNACRMGYDARSSPCPSVDRARRDLESTFQNQLPASGDGNETHKSARKILQQAWTEAVVMDATFIVIQAGNIEIICLRDRNTQTLFVSKVFNIRSTAYPYFKLHTGLYIAAIRDAEDRAARITTGPHPPTWTMTSGIEAASVIDLTPYTNKALVISKLYTMAKARPWLKITTTGNRQPFTKNAYQRTKLLSIPYEDGWDPKALTWNLKALTAPKVVSRLADDHESTEGSDREDDVPRPVFKPSDFIRLVAEESFHGQLICRAKLEIPGVVFNANFKARDGPWVILKNALHREEILQLERESRILEWLDYMGFKHLPNVFGFFTFMDSLVPDASFGALLMEDKGISLQQLRLESESNKPFCVTEAQKDRFVSLLKDIHKLQILHGNLSRKSLLFQRDNHSSLDVYIIGFERAISPYYLHSQPPPWGPAAPLDEEGKARIQEQMAEEHKMLVNLLSPVQGQRAKVREQVARRNFKLVKKNAKRHHPVRRSKKGGRK